MSNRNRGSELLRLKEKMDKAYTAFVRSPSKEKAKENYRKYYTAQQEYKACLEELRMMRESDATECHNQWYTVAMDEYDECGRLGSEGVVEHCSKRYSTGDMSA